jgi:hypothetical protein
MNTCANCTDPAVWLWSGSNTQRQFYCATHAPRAFKDILIPVATQEDVSAKIAEIEKSTKKSTTSTVIKSTPKEEVVDSISNDNEPTEEEVTDNESDE